MLAGSGGWRAIAALIATTMAVLVPAAGADDAGPGVVREPVAFTVTNPLVPGTTYTVRGEIVRPVKGCGRSVVLAMHGLSYGWWAWDFPLQGHTYSVAQALAARGYPVVTIDELGYGSSQGPRSADHPNGYTLTVQSYAEMTAQIAEQLRSGSYLAGHRTVFSHVALMGHSAGTEVIELAAGLHPGIADLLIPTGYTHEPFANNLWLAREWTTDNERALLSDYEYFETNPSTRAADMYNLRNADPKVVAWDNEHSNLTPSGEILSISPQLSRSVLPLIQVPTLLVLAQDDELFPGAYGAQELSLFTGAADRTLLVAPDDGHSFMLHRNAALTIHAIGDWIARHGRQLPACT